MGSAALLVHVTFSGSGDQLGREEQLNIQVMEQGGYPLEMDFGPTLARVRQSLPAGRAIEELQLTQYGPDKYGIHCWFRKGGKQRQLLEVGCHPTIKEAEDILIQFMRS